MFLGLRTVVYHVEDLARAKDWYTRASGVAPYFDQPFYVGFSVGGYELALDPDMDGVSRGNAQVAYWGVVDIRSEFARLISIGARGESEAKDVGGGILVATVVDPFGNVLGLIENPHFKLPPDSGR